MDYQHQRPQQMYAAYAADLQHQPYQLEQQYVQEMPYLNETTQGHPGLHYVDSFYEIDQSVPTHPQIQIPHAQMPQPSPRVHAPIPILQLNAQFNDVYCYPADDESVGEPTYFLTPDYSNVPHPEVSVPNPWSDALLPETFVAPTFPTPSELLIELGGDDDTGASAHLDRTSSSPTTSTISASPEPGDASTPPERPRALRPRSCVSSRSESLLADAPHTNDSISSHEKKRHYLECIEQYVMYLHNQYRLLGVDPLPLRRVDSYRGLNSRSIRTLLVHVENNNEKLNNRTVAEERKFLALKDEVLEKELLEQNSHIN